MNNKLSDISLSKKIKCTEEEKTELLALIDEIISISEKARSEGLISIEREISSRKDFLFQKGLSLLIDGFEKKDIEKILNNYIIYSGHTGKELLKRLLIREGILSIHEGANTRVMTERLLSYFDEESSANFMRNFSKARYELNSIPTSPPISEKTSLLESFFSDTSNDTVKELLKEINFCDLLKALKGASSNVKIKILSNLSSRARAIAIDGINQCDTTDINEIIEAQQKVLSVLKEKITENKNISTEFPFA